MKIVDVESNQVKLCHLRPGDVFSYIDRSGVEHFLLVCSEKPIKNLPDSGLYKAEGIFFLDLATSLSVDPPHLSSRVKVFPNARIYLE